MATEGSDTPGGFAIHVTLIGRSNRRTSTTCQDPVCHDGDGDGWGVGPDCDGPDCDEERAGDGTARILYRGILPGQVDEKGDLLPGALRYASNQKGAWEWEAVDETEGQAYSGMAVSPSGRVHVLYSITDTPGLRYASRCE